MICSASTVSKHSPWVSKLHTSHSGARWGMTCVCEPHNRLIVTLHTAAKLIRCHSKS